MTSIFKTLNALAALAAVVLLVGCGGDDGESGSSETAAGDDGAAIEETIKGWLLEGGCERMTDEFLEAQTFITDPEEACETFEANFTAPPYGEDDIVISDVESDGAKGSATVGDETGEFESRYELVNEDGAWRIDSADLL